MTARRVSVLMTALLLSLPGAQVPAQTNAKDAPAAKDATALLKAAQDAADKLKSLTYTSKVASEGPLAATAGSYTAEVASRRMDAGGWAVYAKGELTRKAPAPTDPEGAATSRSFEVAYDGVTARALCEAKKELAELSATELADVRLFFMQQDAGKSVAWELAETPAYSESTKDATLALDGKATVDGTECSVLKVTGRSDAGGATVTRYFLAVSDSLPRRIERARVSTGLPAPSDPPAQNKQVLTLSALKPDAPVGPSTFVMSVPDGYTVVASQTRRAEAARRAPRPQTAGERPKRESGLLGVGDAAPDWSLKDGAGKQRSLAEYRGKVVVMDFWGTWCPWCVKAMPAIQKVHEKFQGKPVAVLGMNYESSPTADPAAFMTKNKITYALILGAEKIAPTYKVSGWPTLYVIGADGKVLMAESGFSPDLEAKLTTVITEGLKDAGL